MDMTTQKLVLPGLPRMMNTRNDNGCTYWDGTCQCLTCKNNSTSCCLQMRENVQLGCYGKNCSINDCPDYEPYEPETEEEQECGSR